MSSVRDRIRQNVAAVATDSAMEGTMGSSSSQEDIDFFTDDIIAIVREAMLGEHAMSVARSIEIDMEGAYGMSENTVPAMLDSIGFGEKDG